MNRFAKEGRRGNTVLILVGDHVAERAPNELGLRTESKHLQQYKVQIIMIMTVFI